MNSKAILLLSVLILIFPELTFAHAGDHTEEDHSPQPAEEPVSVNDSIYSIDTGEDSALSNLEETTMNSPFSSINTLGDDDPLINRDIKINDPMKRFKKEEHSPGQHGQHKKQHVEEALHEWVSSEAKGREVAISISILSGIAFMGLCFFKIGEGNKNNTTDY